VPPIVVQDELEAGILVEALRLPDLHEAFWAITLPRRFPERGAGRASCGTE
jgi:LysR family transcriptional activator of nhaA